MHMQKHRNKRRQQIRFAFVYTLMALAVLSIVTILILVVQGYRYNRFDGKIEQGGLVQFDSRPSGATVMVDDITLANRTASKITLSAGRHTVTMSRDGYSTWKKEVTVKAGGLLWLNYPLLFPNNPNIVTSATYEGVANALVSPDHKIMTVVQKSTTPTVSLTTLDTDSPTTKSLTLATASVTPAPADTAEAFSLVAWDKNSTQLILKHTYGDKTEYLTLNIDGKTHNITTELGVDIAKLSYSYTDTNLLYVLTSTHELRRLNMSSLTVSGPLASNVNNFTINEERVVAYETLPDADGVRTVGYVSSGATKAKTIASFSDANDQQLAVSTGNYYGVHYTAIVHNNTLTISKGDLPASDGGATVALKEVARIPLATGGGQVGFSPETNRMVYAASGNHITTYDLELKSSAVVTLQEPMTRGVEWLDPFHIVATGQNSYYYDFDGTNGQLFASNTLNQPATLSPNEKYIYYFAATEDKVVLRRVTLTAN